MSSIAASDENSVRVICGPTSAGKSALAMQLAESHGAVIISADSRQVYRGFDIGTAKPTVAERARIPHRGIDVVEPTERYSAAVWAERARQWLEAARSQGRPAVIVGGTGFYLRALIEPLFEAPTLDPAKRRAFEHYAASLGTEELRRWCRVLDAARAHLGRTQLVRSVETALLTGERLSDLHASRARAPSVRARYLVVDPGAALADRIVQRFDAMVRAGWAEEVETLARTVDESAPAWKASGYGVMRAMASGQISRDEAKERVIIETRQYAKRQRTWFRHQLDPAVTTRIDPGDTAVAGVVNDWWEGRIGV